MTATVETSTTPHNLPVNASDWEPKVRHFLREENNWTRVSISEMSRIIAEALRKMTSMDQVTEENIHEHIIVPMGRDAMYMRGEAADETVTSWLMNEIDEMAEMAEAGSADEEEERPASDGLLDIGILLGDITPRWEAQITERWSTEQWDRIVAIITSQYHHWVKGKYKVTSLDRAVSQFHRRMSTKFGWDTKYDSGLGRPLRHVLGYLRDLTTEGATAVRAPLVPNQEEMEAAAREYGLSDGNNPGGSAYYIGYTAWRKGTAWRSASGDGLPEKDEAVRQIRDFIADYLNLSAYTDAEKDLLYENIYILVQQEFFNHDIVVEGLEEVTDAATLTDWQMTLHPDVPTNSLQHQAIVEAGLEFRDLARTEPDRLTKEGLVTAYRRMVIALGFTKFTGKVARSVLHQALTQVFEAEKGKGLTVEEWQTRFDRKDRMVSYVSGRYGVIHGMCERLEDACKEIGVKPIREPEHTVRFKSANLTVEVVVTSWWDDEGRLRNSAKAAWAKMSPAEQEAAVVRREGVHVDWGQMTVAR